MSYRQLKNLIKLDLDVYKVPIIGSGCIVLFAQLIRMWSILARERKALYGFDAMNQYKILPEIQVSSIDMLLASAGFPYVFILWIMVSAMLPVIFIYRQYMGTKSMYTVMRLPMSRNYYYFAKLIPVCIIGVIQWLLQIGMMTLFCIGYYIAIPAGNRPNHPWESMWGAAEIRWMLPSMNLISWSYLISVIVLPVTMTILLTFLERSRTKVVSMGVILAIEFVALYIAATRGLERVVVPIVTIVTIVISCKYIKKIHIM